MKRSLKRIGLKELDGLVNSHLEKHGVDAVLTGGACVTVYSRNKYQSLDLDFVTLSAEYDVKAILAALQELGFEKAAEGFFARQDCDFIIEFIPPPLAVGSEPVKKIATLRTKYGSLKLLSPTDCVKDRLAAYYHWDDPQSLEQALMVAKRCRINLKEIERWSKVEGKEEKFKEFLKLKQKR